uniref:receptor-type tyrosine-protein phosphatase epsilon-like isoform X1 n=1 Tax=Epinephelus lanceolatus TaxID=310571 RepID=UPI00144836A9|nr:receptor-type tyrosine-protein phosphatase epsilon-like isoform X1 [Epinephelus lanceolatus]
MVLFLIGISIAVNNSSHENQTAENPTHQGAHVLPSTLVISLLLIIVVLLTIYCLRFKNHRKALVTSVDKKIPNGFLEEQGEQTVVLLPRSPSPSKRYFPIPLDSLEEEYRIRSADDGKLFREEFNSLPCYYHHGSFEEASREHNREKNRYPNILPYDHSRVILSHLDGHLCSDYINASYIDVSLTRKERSSM